MEISNKQEKSANTPKSLRDPVYVLSAQEINNSKKISQFLMESLLRHIPKTIGTLKKNTQENYTSIHYTFKNVFVD